VGRLEDSVVRILGVQIANGYAAEARVSARTLGLRDNGHDGLVIHHSWSGDLASAEAFERDARVRLVRIDTGWRPNPDGRRSIAAKAVSHLRFRATLPVMSWLAQRYAPDVVVSSQQQWDCFAASFIARHLKKPQVIHLHYNIGPWLGDGPLRRLRACDHVVAVSDFIRDQLLRYGVPSDRVTTIRNGMAPSPPSPASVRRAVRAELQIPADVPLIGIIARLDRFKGQRETLEAFARIARAHPTAQLLIVGGGTLAAELATQARQTGFAERIHLVGPRNDVARLLAVLDVFIHPSRYDPCPLAVLEAAAAGLPVVAYADGGIPELVADGETGLLAPPGDVDGLAVRLAALLDGPDLRQRMGTAAKQRIATSYSPAAASRTFMDLLAQVAHSCPAETS
jgi:glycosyltransferase involved in cell wall biosynthesis